MQPLLSHFRCDVGATIGRPPDSAISQRAGNARPYIISPTFSRRLI